jgi:hypothetical protein
LSFNPTTEVTTVKTVSCLVTVVRFSGFGNDAFAAMMPVPETVQALWSGLLRQGWGLISGDLVQVSAGPLSTEKHYVIWRRNLVS